MQAADGNGVDIGGAIVLFQAGPSGNAHSRKFRYGVTKRECVYLIDTRLTHIVDSGYCLVSRYFAN